MGGRWNMLGLQLHKVLWVVLMLHLKAHECMSVNLEGRALLRFRSRVKVNPYGALEDWDSQDQDPCNWSGVHCKDGKVETLDLSGLSLGGTLAPEIGRLSHLRYLVLYKNNFSGTIPKEITKLTMLELLDLRGNDLSDIIPMEIGAMQSLKCLLLCSNNFQGSIHSIKKLNMYSKQNCDQNLSFNIDSKIVYVNRKVGQWLKFKRDPSLQTLRETTLENIPRFISPNALQVLHAEYSFRRNLLQETSNLPAAPVSGATAQEFFDVQSVASGSFPAVPSSKSVNTEPLATNTITQPLNNLPPKQTNIMEPEPSASERLRRWLFLLLLPGIAMLAIATSMLACRRKGVATIGPWKTGLSGPLQKAFVAGVPKLNRAELEAACEDFSNIIAVFPVCTIFKGTLSSGVEIAVISTSITSVKDWSKRSEASFRKKIDTLSRVNHKNFVNLIGYCEENEPFMRMMVHEYAPSGTLFHHLHEDEFEHLDWSARMRIIMGLAYCLQYMHHDLSPPVILPDIHSSYIFLTDDYAAKIADPSIWKEVANCKISGEDDRDPSGSHSVDPQSNTYSFGILMLEVISGKLPYSEEQGSLLNWATQYLNDKHNNKNLVDPVLKSFKDEELDAVVEVIEECIHQDPMNRPTMKEVVTKLREVTGISPDAASPRLSPLWWAELEILSAS